MLFIGGTGGGGICNVRYPGGAALVCLLAAVLCGDPHRTAASRHTSVPPINSI